MSFATRGMRQGACQTQPMSQSDKAVAFSNCNVIDYRHGLNFGEPVAAAMLPSVSGDNESRYSLNLDKNGHTVDMHISTARPADSPECHDGPGHTNTVANISDMVAKVSREMVQGTRKTETNNSKQIANLKSEVAAMRTVLAESQRKQRTQVQRTAKEQNTMNQASKARADMELSPQVSADIARKSELVHEGLVHHTGVMQRQQNSINKLDMQVQSLQQVNARLDSRVQHGLRSVTNDAQKHDAGLKHHTQALTSIKATLTSMDAGLLNHKSELRTLKSTTKTSNYADTNVLTALQNELRNLRSQIAISQAKTPSAARAEPVRARAQSARAPAHTSARSAPVLATTCRVAASTGTERLAALMAKYEQGR